MALNLNPQVRSNANVNASTLTRVGSPTLDAAMEELRAKYGPSFANFTQNVTQFVNTGQLDTSPIERTSGTRRVTWRPPISCC